MSIVIPVTVIVVFIGLLVDDLLGWMWRGGHTSSCDMVGLMKKGGGRRG